MINFQENIRLAPYTTFRIGGVADFLVFAQNPEELIETFSYTKSHKLSWLVLGGGSNVLIHDRGFNGLVVRLENIGIDVVRDTKEEIYLKVSSGEIWDDMVRLACEASWFGIENLSHIPGFMGGFAVQNVGAYGQEASQVVVEVEAYDTVEEKIVIIDNKSCQFGYRSSIFNKVYKNRYVILSTTLALKKEVELNLSYGDLRNKFLNTTPNLSEIRNFIIETRNKKFPFPDKPTSGNAGSFFRGPIMTEFEFEKLLDSIQKSFGKEIHSRLAEMSNRLQVPQGYKTPTAFLLELCEQKEQSVGGAIINSSQPAIILNSTGTASSTDVIALYTKVAKEVYSRTSVKLGIEPGLVGFTEEELKTIRDIFR